MTMVPLGHTGTPQRSDSPPPPRGLLDIRGSLKRGGFLKRDIAYKMAMDAIDRFRDCYGGPGTEGDSWTRAVTQAFADNSLSGEEGAAEAFAAKFWRVFRAMEPGPAVDVIDGRPEDVVGKLTAAFTFCFDRMP